MISSLYEFFFFGCYPLPTLKLTEIAHLCESTVIYPYTQGACTHTYTRAHTCSHINKCPSTVSKKVHLEPIVIVSKLPGYYRGSLSFAWHHLSKLNMQATIQKSRSQSTAVRM
jgi:hypothetical protein